MSDLGALLAVASGAVVGLVLGLIGSGGSILALPLLVYAVGYEGDTHVAIGTTALAVAAIAFGSLAHHRREGHVRLRVGLAFAAPGVLGALIGAKLGLGTDGSRILFLFALVMLAAAYRMWPRRSADDGRAEPPRRVGVDFRRVLPAGLGVGVLAGFFGIGGGFLVVPALSWAANLTVREAIGTSLLAVAAFGLTTAVRYGLAGRLDLPVAGLFVVGGVIGGLFGTRLGRAVDGDFLRRVFAGTLVVVAAVMAYRNYALVWA